MNTYKAWHDRNSMALKDKINKAFMIGGIVGGLLGTLGGWGGAIYNEGYREGLKNKSDAKVLQVYQFWDRYPITQRLFWSSKDEDYIFEKRKLDALLNDPNVKKGIEELDDRNSYILVNYAVIAGSMAAFCWGMAKLFEQRYREKYVTRNKSGIDISGYDGWLNPEDL